MNETIKQFMIRSGTDISGKWMSINNAEKFAELIVRECVNRATWAQDTGEKDIGGEILKHFGVEE
jgi:transcription termination factor Rho